MNDSVYIFVVTIAHISYIIIKLFNLKPDAYTLPLLENIMILQTKPTKIPKAPRFTQKIPHISTFIQILPPLIYSITLYKIHHSLLSTLVAYDLKN